MKPPPFEHYAPDSIDEALELVERYADTGKVLAGGQSLVPLLNLRLARPEQPREREGKRQGRHRRARKEPA